MELVKYNSRHDCKGSGELLLHIKERGFCSVHGFLKRIYESIPEYKGKCLWICVHDLSNGQVGIYTLSMLALLSRSILILSTILI